MWAPIRRDSAALAGAGGGEPSAEEHALADLEAAVSGQGGAGVVVQARPVTQEAGADVGTGQVDRAEAAAGSGGEPAKQVHAQADLQAVGVQGGAGIVAQGRPGAVEVAADVGAGQVDRAVVPPLPVAVNPSRRTMS